MKCNVIVKTATDQGKSIKFMGISINRESYPVNLNKQEITRAG